MGALGVAPPAKATQVRSGPLQSIGSSLSMTGQEITGGVSAILGLPGKMVQVVEEDGLQILRVYNADAFETRYAFYGQLVCKAPGFNLNIQIPAN